MKILAFSDLHCDTAAAQQIVDAAAAADLLVGAGDFGARGQDEAGVLRILQQVSVPTLIVAGNHDRPQALAQLCANWDNGHFLAGETIVINDVPFFGLGAAIPSSNDAAWDHAISEQHAAQLLADCPENAVLITHSPPHGHADLQRTGEHEGSTAIRDAIVQKQPLLNLCGHIHFAWGGVSKIGRTPIHNLGPRVNWFEL